MTHFKFFNGVVPWFMVGVGSERNTARQGRPEGFEDNPLPPDQRMLWQAAKAQSAPAKGKGGKKGDPVAPGGKPSDDVGQALETLRTQLGLGDVSTDQLLAKLQNMKT